MNVFYQDNATRIDIPDYEMDAIAREIEAQQKSEDFARALEMPHQQNVHNLLERWQKDMVDACLPARLYLMFHLKNIGMDDLHDKLVQQL